MEVTTEDVQLAFELRELYTITRNWECNLRFKAEETATLKKQITALMRSGLIQEQRDRAQSILFMIDRITFGISKLKDSLPAHLNMLEYLISGAGSYFTVDLIENHARLKGRNDAIFLLFLEAKSEIRLLCEPEAARV
ncbi:MAG TPA: hypothetical protein VGD92_00315 [Sphingobacteriaceae bacterium]